MGTKSRSARHVQRPKGFEITRCGSGFDRPAAPVRLVVYQLVVWISRIRVGQSAFPLDILMASSLSTQAWLEPLGCDRAFVIGVAFYPRAQLPLQLYIAQRGIRLT